MLFFYGLLFVLSGRFGDSYGKATLYKLFPKAVGRFAETSFIDHIFLKSFFSSRRHFTWGKSFSVLLIKDLNGCVTS